MTASLNVRMLQYLQQAVLVVVVALIAACNSVEAASKHEKSKVKPPGKDMTVVLVRSSEPGCEPSCPEWIAANGEIGFKTVALFRKAYRQAGGKPVPVVVNSQGGSVEAAMEIGWIIRRAGSKVVVGTTIFDGCQPRAEDCKTAKLFKGSHVVQPNYCVSACSFVLAGGVQRMTFVNLIGTHQILVTFEQKRVRETYRIVKGKKRVISSKVVSRKPLPNKTTTKLSKSYLKMVKTYFASMGVKPEFTEFFEKATPANIYFMTDAEMRSTRIINAVPVSTALFDKKTCGAPGTFAFCVSRKALSE